MKGKPSWEHKLYQINSGAMLAALLSPREIEVLSRALAEYYIPLLMGSRTKISDAKRFVQWWRARFDDNEIAQMVLRRAKYETQREYVQKAPLMELMVVLADMAERKDLLEPRLPDQQPRLAPLTPNAPGSNAKH